jgi:hypothetical protein
MPEQFMPQPERRRPTGGNVIALHPKLETGFDKPRSPFTGEKKGPLTDAEVADSMAARAPWEKPTEAETPDAPDNVLPFSRKRSPRVLDFSDNPQNLPDSNAALLRQDKVDPLRPTQLQIDEVLRQGEGDRPVFVDAATGESMGLAEVRGREAGAAEGIAPDSDERSALREVYPEDVKDSAGDVVDALDAAVDTSDKRFYVTEKLQDGSVVETGRLDDEHGVRVERDASGKVVEIFVVAAGAGEAHDVTVHPGVEPTQILIDGQPATREELPAVEAVLNHTAEQIAEKPQEDAPETDEAKEDADAEEEQSSPEENEQEKRAMSEYTKQFAESYLRNPSIRKTMTQLGVDVDGLAGRLESGDITVDRQTITYMQNLKKQLDQSSDVWNTPPSERSMLGRAANEARQHLARILKQL